MFTSLCLALIVALLAAVASRFALPFVLMLLFGWYAVREVPPERTASLKQAQATAFWLTLLAGFLLANLTLPLGEYGNLLWILLSILGVILFGFVCGTLNFLWVCLHEPRSHSF